MHEGRDANRDRLFRECQDAQNAIMSFFKLLLTFSEKKKEKKSKNKNYYVTGILKGCVWQLNSLQKITKLFFFNILFSFPKYGITSMKIRN